MVKVIKKRRREAWNTSLFCVFWMMWEQRNQIALEEGIVNVQKWMVFFD